MATSTILIASKLAALGACRHAWAGISLSLPVPVPLSMSVLSVSVSLPVSITTIPVAMTILPFSIAMSVLAMPAPTVSVVPVRATSVASFRVQANFDCLHQLTSCVCHHRRGGCRLGW
ncbi:hypothetical protein EDD16DRAFT_1596755 [Pisolithus croceorrhizus]|nr:hypothetical protein EDD16DRAFT_1596755 [Pisolithus croceorrhizus]